MTLNHELSSRKGSNMRNIPSSVTELSVGVPASLEPPTLHNDLERIQVPRQ